MSPTWAKLAPSGRGSSRRPTASRGQRSWSRCTRTIRVRSVSCSPSARTRCPPTPAISPSPAAVPTLAIGTQSIPPCVRRRKRWAFPRSNVTVLGFLEPIHTVEFTLLVVPVVGRIDPVPELKPSAREVAMVLEPTLETLHRPGRLAVRDLGGADGVVLRVGWRDPLGSHRHDDAAPARAGAGSKALSRVQPPARGFDHPPRFLDVVPARFEGSRWRDAR